MSYQHCYDMDQISYVDSVIRLMCEMCNYYMGGRALLGGSPKNVHKPFSILIITMGFLFWFPLTSPPPYVKTANFPHFFLLNHLPWRRWKMGNVFAARTPPALGTTCHPWDPKPLFICQETKTFVRDLYFVSSQNQNCRLSLMPVFTTILVNYGPYL